MQPSYAVAFIAAILVLVRSSNAQSTADELLNRPRRGANIHGPALFRSLRPCCYWPTIISRASYDNCTALKANSSSTVIYDRMCHLDCVMKSASYINGTALNYTAIGIRFSKSAGITFPTVAIKAVEDCKTYVENLNGTFPTIAPPTGIRSCNPKAALAWICIRHKFLLNSCARTAAQEESCAANFEKLKALTPLELLNRP